MLQKLHDTGETGRLSFSTPMARGSVRLTGGEVLDAEIGVRRGQSALHLLAILNEGTLTFAAEPCTGERTLPDIPALVKDVEAKTTGALAVIQKLPSLIEALSWEPVVLEGLKGRYPSQTDLIASLRSGGTLLEALVEVDVELVEALELLQAAVLAQREFEARRPVPVEVRSGNNSDAKLPGMVGVRPRRTVLGSERPTKDAPERSSGPPAGVSTTRTLVGGSVMTASSGPVAGTSGGSAGPKVVATSSAPSTSSLEGDFAIGDEFELGTGARPAAPASEVPESRRGHSSQPPPPSSMGGQSIVLSGKVLTRVAVLSEGPRFIVHRVSSAELRNGTDMALKMPRRPAPDAIEGIKVEASVLGAVSHPNIVGLAQAGMDVDMPYLLTWFWPSLALRELYQLQSRLPLGLVLGVTCQVLDALCALHETRESRAGVVHANLCPENLLVGLDGVVRLCGFSSARRSKDKPGDEDLAVHARYAAPELLRGQRVDERADLFSVGLVLFEATEMCDGASAIKGICLRASDRSPSGRYASAKEFAAELRAAGEPWDPGQVAAWLATEVTQRKVERARSSSDPPGQSSSGRRGLVWLTVGLLLVAIAVVAALVLKK